ncbi:Uncharacterised protein [Achromobacter xylosoxidans]|nr:Uncharacterised protein [Achromobacter xylosoxidans]
MLPSGARPVACVCACVAPLAANQPLLNAAGAAWAPPAASISSNAAGTGLSRPRQGLAAAERAKGNLREGDVMTGNPDPSSQLGSGLPSLPRGA